MSLQNVAYSLGLLSMKDSISMIEERMSDRYFLSFLSIYKVFCILKFFFEIRVIYTRFINEVNITPK